MKTKIARRIARMFTRKTYLATVLLAGSIAKIPVTAPDHRRAMEEIQRTAKQRRAFSFCPCFGRAFPFLFEFVIIGDCVKLTVKISLLYISLFFGPVLGTSLTI